MTDESKTFFPFIVVGDGVIDVDKIARSLRLIGKTKIPIPNFRMARTKKKAEEFKEDMKPWNKMIVVARVEEVWFDGQED